MERWSWRGALGAAVVLLACSGEIQRGTRGSDPANGDDFGAGCVAKTCSDLGANCGTVENNCGDWLQCGVCPSGQICGGGGAPNVCGAQPCMPKTCADLGANCGRVSDGCGTLLACGTCAEGETCGGGGVPDVCGSGSGGGGRGTGTPDGGTGGDTGGSKFSRASTRWVLQRPGADMGADGAGNLYLTRSRLVQTSWELTIDKIDSSGTTLWTKDETLSGGLSQLEVSPGGDLYVFGDLYPGDPAGPFGRVVKLAPSGDPVWNPGISAATIHGLAIDSRGSIVLLENSSAGAFIVKYGSDGLLQWEQQLNPLVRSIATDGSDDILLVGSANGQPVIDGDPRTVGTSGRWTPFILKLDGDGHLVWFDAVAGASGDLALVGTTALGTVVAVGALQGSFGWGGDPINAPSPESMLIVADAGGTQRFARAVPVPTYPQVLAVDPSGMAAIAGSDDSRTAVAAFNLTGDLLWTRQFDGYDLADGTGIEVMAGTFLANHDLVLLGGFWGTERFDGHALTSTSSGDGFLLDLQQQ